MENRVAKTKNKDNEGLDPIDVHVGSKVKARRLLMGLSQDNLAKLIGLTFQQVQKYERGKNRISVSRLIDIAKALKVPVSYFFTDNMNTNEVIGNTASMGFADNKQDDFALDIEPLSKKDVIELIKAYTRIEDPSLKKQLLEMAKTMAKSK